MAGLSRRSFLRGTLGALAAAAAAPVLAKLPPSAAVAPPVAAVEELEPLVPTVMRFDVMYGFRVLQPNLMCRVCSE